MGNCAGKQVKVVPAFNIETSKNFSEKYINPEHPDQDVNYKYLWKSIHSTNHEFLKLQIDGFVIATKNIEPYGWVWLWKLRKIN